MLIWAPISIVLLSQLSGHLNQYLRRPLMERVLQSNESICQRIQGNMLEWGLLMSFRSSQSPDQQCRTVYNCRFVMLNVPVLSLIYLSTSMLNQLVCPNEFDCRIFGRASMRGCPKKSPMLNGFPIMGLLNSNHRWALPQQVREIF